MVKDTHHHKPSTEAQDNQLDPFYVSNLQNLNQIVFLVRMLKSWNDLKE